MTSTVEFFGSGATLTVHRPPGSPEAVLMIESVDTTASITLAAREIKKLVETLQPFGTTGERLALDRSNDDL